MIRLSELKLPLSQVPTEVRRAADAPAETEADRADVPHPLDALRALAAERLGLSLGDIAEVQVYKRSFDARKAEILAVYIVDVRLRDESKEAQVLTRLEGTAHVQASPDMRWQPPVRWPAQEPLPEEARPVIVGFGPCGMLAALALAQMGLKPLVLERGPTVRERTQDTWDLWRRRQLHPQSNVQFGEGGAGTFSDGKLYSQVRDPRYLGRKVLEEFVQAGAPADILYAAHPHIGTFKLVKVVEQMRQEIERLGGQVLFHQQVCALHLAPGSEPGSGPESAPAGGSAQPRPWHLRGLSVRDTQKGEERQLPARQLVLALGHSARDTFLMLHEAGVALQAKAFSVGVRIEHPQSWIDAARWGRHAGHPLLGAADYRLVHHARNGRTAYSFCMCPGGTVVAATSEEGRVVTNGMSQYSRSERNANAGFVVDVEPSDFPTEREAWIAAWGPACGARLHSEAQALAAREPQAVHPLAGVVLQRQLESSAYDAGGGNYNAPAQRVGDFLAGRPSTGLGAVQPSYRPGVTPTDLAQVLPEFVTSAMREALPVWGRKIKSYDHADALLTGVETRTSSPLRIPRGDDFQSLNVQGLYPAGEGAGYAGGILSAAIDGIKVAEAVAQHCCTSAQGAQGAPQRA